MKGKAHSRLIRLAFDFHEMGWLFLKASLQEVSGVVQPGFVEITSEGCEIGGYGG